VSGARLGQNIKISVGANPWSKQRRRHDIGALCARFGGGGHAAVGGVTLGLDELARARAAMAAIVHELATT
jgi:nanoRNase/pAp phosphatase (c-di-AMP/oligoRNAs hydrolase)